LAVEQVQDIATYIALDKPSVAIEWTEKIFHSVNQLIEFPDSGRIVPEIKRKEIRELVLKNHRVIYEDFIEWKTFSHNTKCVLCNYNIKPIIYINCC